MSSKVSGEKGAPRPKLGGFRARQVFFPHAHRAALLPLKSSLAGKPRWPPRPKHRAGLQVAWLQTGSDVAVLGQFVIGKEIARSASPTTSRTLATISSARLRQNASNCSTEKLFAHVDSPGSPGIMASPNRRLKSPNVPKDRARAAISPKYASGYPSPRDRFEASRTGTRLQIPSSILWESPCFRRALLG